MGHCEKLSHEVKICDNFPAEAIAPNKLPKCRTIAIFFVNLDTPMKRIVRLKSAVLGMCHICKTKFILL
jgi:hypothetical protein